MTLLTNTSQTMSSLEIAELTGKEHKDVLRDIRTTIAQYEQFLSKEQICAMLKESSYLVNNRAQPMFELNKQASLDIVTGYSLEMRHKVNKRWQELEAKQTTPVLAKQMTKKELALDAKYDAQIAKSKAQEAFYKDKMETQKILHQQKLTALAAKSTKYLAQGAKVKGDMVIGKVIMPRKTITQLLKEHKSIIEPKDANYALVQLGYLSEDRKTITELGSLYGTSNKTGNGKATQPFWFESEFKNLIMQIEIKLIVLGILNTRGEYYE